MILTNEDYHRSRADAVVVAVSSEIANSYYGDYVLTDWRSAGLPVPSKAKGVIQTIERSTIESTYGRLSNRDFQQLKSCLRSMLGLDPKK